MVNVGDFGEFEAQVVVFGRGEGGIDSTHLLVGSAPQQAEVEGHEINKQTVFGVGKATEPP
jgi:hypothetical protein